MRHKYVEALVRRGREAAVVSGRNLIITASRSVRRTLNQTLSGTRTSFVVMSFDSLEPVGIDSETSVIRIEGEPHINGRCTAGSTLYGAYRCRVGLW